MVYRKRYTKKNSTLKKSALKKMMKAVAYSTQETKHHRVVEEDLEIQPSGSMVELNTVDTQGITAGTFIGQEIRQVGIRLRGKLQQEDSSNIVRWVVLSLSEAFAQELTAGTSDPNGIFYDPGLAIFSPIISTHVNKVYVDKTVVLNQQDAANNKIVLLNKWVPLGMKKYRFNEQSNTAPKDGSDKIYLMLFSDSAFGSHPGTTFHSVLFYKDA